VRVSTRGPWWKERRVVGVDDVVDVDVGLDAMPFVVD
jgi:hypothetical protein